MGRLVPISEILFVTASTASGDGCELSAAIYDSATGNVTAAWLQLKAELERPVGVVPHRDLDHETRQEVAPPSVLARAQDGTLFRLMDAEAIARCGGNLAHIRGRMLYRAGKLGLDIPGALNAAVVVGALRASKKDA